MPKIKNNWISYLIFTCTIYCVEISPALAVGPSITSQPASQIISAVGQPASLSVTAGPGPGPLNYQWFKDGTLQLGQTNSTLSFALFQFTNTGSYRVVIANTNGLTISMPAFRALCNAPLLGWGNHDFGELGNGNKINTKSAIVSSMGVIAAAAGANHSLFVKTDRTLWATGYNQFGQLGNGTMTEATSPTIVASNVVAVAAGAYHSLFIKADGSLWAMGINVHGNLGTGNTSDTNVPVQVVASNVVAVAAGAYHSLFIKADGSLWAMGFNQVLVVASNVVAAAAGAFHSLINKADGSLWVMGSNANGQLGNGLAGNTNFPVLVANNVLGAAGGTYHSIFIRTNGVLLGMGNNTAGQLGNGKNSNTNLPVNMASNIVALAAGAYHSVFIKGDGTVWSTGDNSYGQLGNGTVSASTNLPVPAMAAGITAAAILTGPMANHNLAIAGQFPIINPAYITLDNLSTNYDGTAKPVKVTISPPGLSYLVTYNGSLFAPTNAGSYQVIAVVTQSGYLGSTTNLLKIFPSSASIMVSNLLQTYDGTGKSVITSTTPDHLNLDVTYAGSSALPTNAGNYEVITTVNNSNYFGSATNVLVIEMAPQNISFPVLPVLVEGDAPITLAANASSGLPVTFTSANPIVATVSNQTLTVGQVGVSLVSAWQNGNANYLPTNINQFLMVTNLKLGFAIHLTNSGFLLLPNTNQAGAGITNLFTPAAILTITGNIGRSYTILYQDQLSQTNWSELQTITNLPSETYDLPDLTLPAQRYYRLRRQIWVP